MSKKNLKIQNLSVYDDASEKLLLCLSEPGTWSSYEAFDMSYIYQKLNFAHSDYGLSTYNHVHNILRLFDGWANFPFTRSEKTLWL